MSSRFKYIKHGTGWRGEAKVYLDTCTGGGVVVSRAFTSDRGDETMIFPFDLELNEVTDWDGLYAGYGVSHEWALAEYEVQLTETQA